jgi:hypothetical protein
MTKALGIKEDNEKNAIQINAQAAHVTCPLGGHGLAQTLNPHHSGVPNCGWLCTVAHIL